MSDRQMYICWSQYSERAIQKERAEVGQRRKAFAQKNSVNMHSTQGQQIERAGLRNMFCIAAQLIDEAWKKKKKTRCLYRSMNKQSTLLQKYVPDNLYI